MNSLDKIILGTVQLGLDYGINNSTGKPDSKEAFKILELAYKNGICTLDTANAYGNAEEIIGDYHKTNPKFKVNTKFHADTGFNFEENLSATLQRLNID